MYITQIEQDFAEMERRTKAKGGSYSEHMWYKLTACYSP
jgi:hypothetical protein